MRLSKDFFTVFAIAFVITTITDVLLWYFARPEAEIWGGNIIDYWAFFGMFWYLVIITVSKWIGRFIVQRPEDYYEKQEDHE